MFEFAPTKSQSFFVYGTNGGTSVLILQCRVVLDRESEESGYYTQSHLGVSHFIDVPLVPDTTDKYCLGGSKVLQQFDKKLIPIVSNTTLAIIDQQHQNTTSKYSHCDNMHAFPVNFGLKGEALSSTSDVSLLEVVAQTHGRPNEHRKVLKCLFLGIADCRQDVGITDINSRFVSKGPIHKLLDNIAMSFDGAFDIEKQSRSRIYPLFC
ncbi:uncharacterized protein LOC107011138 [Solanum pennellii]|uniref:Uncharacterized protein LOC107011138 n=1 Tax=Solanum pennellii TaxID=28526 RepID=A0ABM1G4S7_SOLPN|nr:uncharacterized protein LOC107011138 [Solanum pennellii]